MYISIPEVAKKTHFEFDSRIITNTKYLENLDAKCICSLIYIYSICFQENEYEFLVNDKHVDYFSRVSYLDFLNACKILVEYKFIKISDEKIEKLKEKKPKKVTGAVVELHSAIKFPEYLVQVTDEIQKKWLKMFPLAMVVDELDKASLWIEANKHKSPKSNYAAFFTRWLVKAYERHRKGIIGYRV